MLIEKTDRALSITGAIALGRLSVPPSTPLERRPSFLHERGPPFLVVLAVDARIDDGLDRRDIALSGILQRLRYRTLDRQEGERRVFRDRGAVFLHLAEYCA